MCDAGARVDTLARPPISFCASCRSAGLTSFYAYENNLRQRKGATRRASSQFQPGTAANRRVSARAPKYVYTWGNNKADGNGSMKPLARRQRRQPRRDDPHRTAGASGIHDHDRSLHLLLRAQEAVSADAAGRDGEGPREHGADHGHEVRRHDEDAAARRRAFRRARLDARHDGHDPQSRAERRDRAGARRARRRTSASPGIATAASSRCTATSSWACRSAKAKITIRSSP